jgi:hypothetical protein
MGIGRFFGQRDEPRARDLENVSRPGSQQGEDFTDEQAVERYRYMLRTAPPETIEQAHEEAFGKLTERQRQLVLEQLREATPERDRGTASTDPRSLARLATRAEVRQPGTLERTFGGMRGPGFGGLMAGTFLSSLAGTVIGSMIAQHFFADAHREAMAAEGSDETASDDDNDTGEDADSSEDADVADDFDGGDFGDAGSDFGA